VLHLRLNARILTEAPAAPVMAEVHRAGGTAQEAEALAGKGPAGAFPPDGLALALENLSANEADRLNRLMAAAGGTISSWRAHAATLPTS